MTSPAHQTADPERRARYRRGRWSERFAAAMLRLKGYRILAHNQRMPLGEIDLIAVRGGRIAFVEVKRRRNRITAEAAITPRQRQRIQRAAEIWIARNLRYASHERGFDVVFVLPWRWPQHIVNGL